MSKYQKDPLELLRNAYANKKYKIKSKGNDLYFEKQAKLDVKTETAWMSPQTNKRYSLGSIWLCLEYHLKNISNSNEYMQKASEYGVDIVNIADKDETIRYFTGEISQSAYLNEQLKISLFQNKKRENPLIDNDPNEDKLIKKIKGDGNVSFQLQVIDYLMTFQKPINSKSRCMTFQNKSFEAILKNISDQQKQGQKMEVSSTKYRVMKIIENKKLPIIIVPEQQKPGNLTIGNIEKFLVSGIYDEGAKLQNSWASKTEIETQLRGKRIIFEVTSRPTLLLEKDWENVVCIFVQGKQHQFDGWPQTNPKAIFGSRPGFFLKYPQTVSSATYQWKIKHLIVDKTNRYGDRQLAASIWKDIEGYIFEKI